MTKWDVYGIQNWVERVTPGDGTTVNAANTTKRLTINTAGLAALTITFPDNPLDFQPFRIYSKSAIVAVTLAAGAGGATIEDAITALLAEGSAEYTYHMIDGKWYRTL